MVGAINPPTSGSNTFTNFMSAALKIGSNGEPTVTGGSFASGGVGAIATASPANTATTTAGSGSGSGSTSGVVGPNVNYAFSLLSILIVAMSLL